MISFRVTSSDSFLRTAIRSKPFIEAVSSYIDSSFDNWYLPDYGSQLEGYYISSLYSLLSGNSIDKDLFKHISKSILVEQSSTRVGIDKEKNVFILRCYTWTIVRKN